MDEILRKTMRILVLLLPAVTLFGWFIVPTASQSIDIIPFYLAIAVLLGLWYCIIARPVRPLGSVRIYCLFFIVMLIYACISLLWVRNLGQSFVSLYLQAIGVASALLIAASIKERPSLYRLLDVLTVCYAAILILGIYEIYTGHFIFSPLNPELRLKNDHHLFFPYTVFGNTNDFATYVTLFMPFAAYDIIIRFKGWAGKLAGAALCAFAFFTIDNADARACEFAVVLTIAAFLFFIVLKRNMRRFVVPMLAGAAALLLAVIAYLVKSGAAARLLRSLMPTDDSVHKRLELIKAAFRMLADYHFMGVGVGNSVTLVPFYCSLTTQLNLHNFILQILTEYGIVIFVLFAAVLVAIAVKFFRYSTDARRDVVLCGLCFATVCSFPLVGIASSDMTHLTPVWLLWGLWFACLRIFYPEGKDILDRIFGSKLLKRQSGASSE